MKSSPSSKLLLATKLNPPNGLLSAAWHEDVKSSYPLLLRSNTGDSGKSVKDLAKFSASSGSVTRGWMGYEDSQLEVSYDHVRVYNLQAPTPVFRASSNQSS